MPKSIDQILQHAEQLSKFFEDFDPAMGQPFEPHEFRLQRLIMDRANLEREILDAIIMARQKGMTWRKIGEMLGVSAQAAHQQYGALIIAN
ncbi:MAG: hypothetical protein ABIQ38_09785 [Ilumatobacteraceae bacterium]